MTKSPIERLNDRQKENGPPEERKNFGIGIVPKEEFSPEQKKLAEELDEKKTLKRFLTDAMHNEMRKDGGEIPKEFEKDIPSSIILEGAMEMIAFPARIQNIPEEEGHKKAYEALLADKKKDFRAVALQECIAPLLARSAESMVLYGERQTFDAAQARAHNKRVQPLLDAALEFRSLGGRIVGDVQDQLDAAQKSMFTPEEISRKQEPRLEGK